MAKKMINITILTESGNADVLINSVLPETEMHTHAMIQQIVLRF